MSLKSFLSRPPEKVAIDLGTHYILIIQVIQQCVTVFSQKQSITWRPVVGDFNIFIIRAILGVVFAVVLTRLFYPETSIVYVIALAVFLIGMAYFFEYLRKNKTKS